MMPSAMPATASAGEGTKGGARASLVPSSSANWRARSRGAPSLASGILMQMVGELGQDPPAAARRDPGRGQLGLKGVQVGHASTASIVLENRRQRSRLAPSSFTPRLVML